MLKEVLVVTYGAVEAKRNWVIRVPLLLLSLAVVVGLAILANRLSVWGNSPFGRPLVEYPLWAVAVGLLANLVLSLLQVKDKVQEGFRTELFLKVGLVLMGASINFGLILQAGSRGMVQAVVGVTAVFFFTWYVSRLFRLDEKLRALLSTSVSICGVSAAIAAAGSVLARREQLAYVTTLVILFALPLMVLQPILAKAIGLSAPVAGAWIGNNIDTTAAVVGAGKIHSEQAMQVATIVKLSQNTLIGVVAFLLALYWVLGVERRQAPRPSPWVIWERFPKFILGFLLLSLLVSFGVLGKAQVAVLTNLRNWFLTLAFVCIGLEFSVSGVRQVGARPLLVYAIATLFNTALSLGLAVLLFGGV